VRYDRRLGGGLGHRVGEGADCHAGCRDRRVVGGKGNGRDVPPSFDVTIVSGSITSVLRSCHLAQIKKYFVFNTTDTST
jgi:hypothetical protein